MTNPKIRKSNQKSTAVVNLQHQQNEEDTDLLNVLNDSGGGVELNLDDYSFEPTSNSEYVDEEEDEASSCSSFSLQECINEFRARRIRRLSTQSREVRQTEEVGAGFAAEKCALPDPADADLINQNRSNKEQERKCKPCRDGFCYCFTSDSGDGGGACAAANARAGQGRHLRRHRRSDCPELSTVALQSYVKPTDHKNAERESIPASFKIPAEKAAQTSPHKQKKEKNTRNAIAEATTNGNELTAISRLETSAADAPLIHIIQELHNNCVISEVRVNKHKLQTNRERNGQQAIKLSPPQTPQPHMTYNMREPTAPLIENETITSKQAHKKRETHHASALEKISELDSLSDAFAYSTPLTNSSKHTDSGRRRHKAGGRLLQKRLSLSSVHSKPRRSLQAPPKPPRTFLCLEEKSTVSSWTSTTPSLREAERILDEFLIRKGAMVREAEEKAAKSVGKVDKAAQVDMTANGLYAAERRREQRKSCPSSLTVAEKSRRQHILPSCPSLSDLERSALDSNKKYNNYEKNIRQIVEKPIKEHSFGWKERKITEMLNCDIATRPRKFKSQAVQAEPQQSIGWQVPPKVDLDTVDGVCSNLAANIATKHTPIKAPPISTPKKARESQKFIWKEQWRNLSPWCNKQAKSGDRALKSNLKSSSRTLLSSSKKKILRLVTPKRDNIPRRRNYSSHSIGIQTSREELQPYEPSMTPLSPPGSYHSAVQSSTQTTTTPTCSQNTNGTETQNFDFSRTVHPPPKKAPRAASQRKLNFPLSACPLDGSCISCEHGTLNTSMKTKTYRSYHGDLDQDVTLSKLGYILGNIRAKLEASDDHAVRTFQEIERREQRAVGFDCTDGQIVRPETRSQMDLARHRSQQRNLHQREEPIYSEIEEDSIHITGTPQYDNTTSATEMLTTKPDVEVLYAKVNKANKKPKSHVIQAGPMALGKLLHDSLRNLEPTPYVTQLPTLQEQSGSDTSYMSPPQPHANTSDISTTLSHCHSLNNVRVQEQHSPPKRDRNLSKSDMSLHRSEIFLDNLCRSELILENDELDRLDKLNNNDFDKSSCSMRTDSIGQVNTYRHFSTSTPTPNDSISYDTPNDADFDNLSQAAVSEVDLNLCNASMTSGALNTPKKQNAPKFTTKSNLSTQRSSNRNLSTDNFTSPSSCHQPSSSCPATPRKVQLGFLDELPHTSSLKDMPQAFADHQQYAQPQQQLRTMSNLSSNSPTEQQPPIANSCIQTPASNSNAAPYQRLKDVLRKSFKRSTKFVKNETRRLSSSFSFPSSHIALSKRSSGHNQTDPNLHTASSTYDLDALFTLDDHAPVTQQLAQAVTICRQLPEVEISPEMVEAERLLLFSHLRRDVWPERLPTLALVATTRTVAQHTHRFFVDSLLLPIKVDVNHDFFFNYFYIVTFECGGVIKSTQSAECHNGQAIFSECGIEFAGDLAHDHAEMHCKIFMLRLRKVSTLSLEPKRPIVKLSGIRTPGASSSTSSSSDEIVSRFRLHASFSLNARNFVPYEYVECESDNTNKICMRAGAKSCLLPLTMHTKSTNLCTEIQLSGRAEMRLPKHSYSGFLNVQDPHTQHSWNRRWCTLDGINVRVWPDENQVEGKLLLTLDMRSNVQSTPLQVAPRELCARARAFCLQCTLKKGGEEVDTAAVFFAADTQEELEMWLEQLNAVLMFVDKWLSAERSDAC